MMWSSTTITSGVFPFLLPFWPVLPLLWSLSQLHWCSFEWWVTTDQHEDLKAFKEGHGEGGNNFKFTSAPVLVKSLLSTVVGYLSTLLPGSVRHFLNLNWYERFNKLQNVTTQGLEGQYKCPTGSDEQLHQQTPCGEIHLKLLCDSKQLEQPKREKHRRAQWPPGREGRGNHSSSSAPGIPSTAQGWPCQLCSHSCSWILSQPEELANSAFQSLHWVRHLSSFKCSCSFNWPEAVNGGKQQLLYTCLECPEADDCR